MTEAKQKSPFVTIETLAQYFCVSVSTIRVWTRQGHIPENTYIKLGNTYRYNRDAVTTALTSMGKEEDGVGQSVVVTGQVGSVATTATQNEDQLEFNFDADEDA